MDNMCNTIQEISIKNVQPAIECLIFRLSELRGLSLLNRKLKEMEKKAEKATREAMALLLISHQLVQSSIQYRSDLKLLFLWLSRRFYFYFLLFLFLLFLFLLRLKNLFRLFYLLNSYFI